MEKFSEPYIGMAYKNKKLLQELEEGLNEAYGDMTYIILQGN